MIRTSTKSQIGWGVLTFLLALALGIAVGGDRLAVVLLAIMAFSLLIRGLSFVAIRERVEAGYDDASSTSIWPIAGAISVVLLVLGFTVNGWYVVLGGVVLAIAIGGALGQAWREDFGWSSALSDRLGERVVRPVGLPLLAVVGIGVFAIAISRVLLANSEHIAVTVALIVAAAMMVVFSILASLRNIRPTALIALSALAVGVLVLSGGLSAGAGAVKPEHEAKDVPTVTLYAKASTWVENPNTEDPAKDKFSYLELAPQERVRIRVVNKDDNVVHNAAIYTEMKDQTSQAVWNGAPAQISGTSTETLVTPMAGTYELRCDFHPTSMKIALQIKEGAGE